MSKMMKEKFYCLFRCCVTSGQSEPDFSSINDKSVIINGNTTEELCYKVCVNCITPILKLKYFDNDKKFLEKLEIISGKLKNIFVND